MTEDFIAMVLFDAPPALSAAGLQDACRALDPDAALDVIESDAGGELIVRAGEARLHLAVVHSPIPEDAAISSIGMADIPEDQAQRLLHHKSHVLMRSDQGSAATSMEKIIAVLKAGIVLCGDGGWALCLPSSGLCLSADVLAGLAELNQGGPRVWGVDEAEGDLPGYDKYTLWESLRCEAQPVNLLVGFIPAQIQGNTWFFSAGHSFFGLPEIVFPDATLDDFHTVRGLFGYIFPYFYQRPELMTAGQSVKTSDGNLLIAFEELSPEYSELQSATGTLRVVLRNGADDENIWE